MPETIPQDLIAGLEGRYELERVVGRGGMATVYAARDAKHGRRVAVKVLRPDLAASLGNGRFLKEIEIAAHLTHPHILPLYDSGAAGDFLYYVMPFVEGESVRNLLDRVGLMDVHGAREIVRRVADALEYAHRQGVLHRDIKPENILLPDGHAVVADFGIAKAVSSAADRALTRTGIAVGTPGYMSPEQAAGLADLDVRTDVYSLGVVAYEMVMGGLPGAWLSPDDQRAGRFLEARAEHQARLERLPRGMERALVRALAVRREDRFATPGEFASAWEHPEEYATRAGAAIAPHPEAYAAERPSVEPSATRTPPVRETFVGAPTTLVVERVVAGEVPTREFQVLVEEIRATFEVLGHEAVSEHSLMWTARRPRDTSKFIDWEKMIEQGDDGPKVLVRIGSRRGRTRIRIEQSVGEMAGGIYGGTMGGGVGGVGGGAIAVAAATMGLPLVGVLLFSGVILTVTGAGSYLLSRTMYRSYVASKLNQLESLADRLAAHCEDVAV